MELRVEDDFPLVVIITLELLEVLEVARYLLERVPRGGFRPVERVFFKAALGR